MQQRKRDFPRKKGFTREMQGRISEVQGSLARLRVQGNAGGGMVTVESNGQRRILACKIEESLFESGDQEMVEELVVAAVNQALDKAREAEAEEMGKITGGLGLPGLGEALSKLGLGGIPTQ